MQNIVCRPKGELLRQYVPCTDRTTSTHVILEQFTNLTPSLERRKIVGKLFQSKRNLDNLDDYMSSD